MCINCRVACVANNLMINSSLTWMVWLIGLQIESHFNVFLYLDHRNVINVKQQIAIDFSAREVLNSNFERNTASNYTLSALIPWAALVFERELENCLSHFLHCKNLKSFIMLCSWLRFHSLIWQCFWRWTRMDAASAGKDRSWWGGGWGKELATSRPFSWVRSPEAITAGKPANLVIYMSALSLLQNPNQRQWPAVLIRS